MSQTQPSTANFLSAFGTAETTERPGLVAVELARSRDSFRCIVQVAAARSIDTAAFVQGLQIALRDDPANLPGLRLLAWHQIRESQWAEAKQTLQSLILRWPSVTDVRRELTRVGMMSPGSDGEEFLKLAAIELHNRGAQLSYQCQNLLANGQSISAATTDELKLNLDRACAQIFRRSAANDGVIPEKSALVFLEILKRLIAAPTIALVGNGPSLNGSKLGAEIDANDVVIRCNFPKISGFREDVGNKTDIMFFNESLVNVLPRLVTQDVTYEQCLSLAFHPEPAAAYATELYARNMTERISRISLRLREFYRNFFYTRPTTGMMGIILITVVLGKNLSVYGFDFYSNPTTHYFPSTSPVFLGHELQYEQWFLRHFLPWLDQGKVIVGPSNDTSQGQS